MTPIYVINLARRRDRLEAVTRVLDAAGLSFIRIDAVDAQSADPAWLDKPFARPNALTISTGDKACALSHFKAYEQFLSSPDHAQASHAIILEDDVGLTDRAGALLSSCDWLPASVNLLKLERMTYEAVLLGKAETVAGPDGDVAIAPLLSMHLGTGGYIISRAAAAAILAITPKPMMPIDHLLFNPTRSPIFNRNRPRQLTPAIVVQVGVADSDIKSTWAPLNIYSWNNVRREATRLHLQVKRLPYVIAALALGARYRKISVGNEAEPTSVKA